MILSLGDQHQTPNNSGFNLTKFKARYLSDFLEQTILDYEKTFIGSFFTQFMHTFLSLGYSKSLDLSMSLTLFEGQSALSLI